MNGLVLFNFFCLFVLLESSFRKAMGHLFFVSNSSFSVAGFSWSAFRVKYLMRATPEENSIVCSRIGHEDELIISLVNFLVMVVVS